MHVLVGFITCNAATCLGSYEYLSIVRNLCKLKVVVKPDSYNAKANFIHFFLPDVSLQSGLSSHTRF